MDEGREDEKTEGNSSEVENWFFASNHPQTTYNSQYAIYTAKLTAKNSKAKGKRK